MNYGLQIRIFHVVGGGFKNCYTRPITGMPLSGRVCGGGWVIGIIDQIELCCHPTYC